MRRRRRNEAGYTLVEVMMAVAIMTVGSVGILSLHQATTRGNRQAREMSMAVDLNRLYLERARRDALRWNATGAVSSTEIITNVGADWFIPVLTIGSNAFDYQGNDTAVLANQYYCTNLRVSWIIGQDAVRVDSRVWWRRSDANPTPSTWNCSTAAATITTELDAPPAGSPRIHVATASTVVHWQRLN